MCHSASAVMEDVELRAEREGITGQVLTVRHVASVPHSQGNLDSRCAPSPKMNRRLACAKLWVLIRVCA